jgi:hypothetical protein
MKQLELPFHTAEEYHKALKEYIKHVTVASGGITFLSPPHKSGFTPETWKILTEVWRDND